MLKVNLFLEECMLTNDVAAQRKRLKAVHSLKHLLSQIDSRAEELPFGDPQKLQRLFTSLKGEAMDKEETALLLEIAKY